MFRIINPEITTVFAPGSRNLTILEFLLHIFTTFPVINLH